MASRTPYNSTTIGPITGPSYMDNVKDRIKDVWDMSHIRVITISGTNDLVGVCDPPLLAAPTRGMKFTFLAPATNSGAMTIALDGQAPISLVDDSNAALLSGAIVSGRMYVCEQTSTTCRVQNTSGVIKINDYQVFTANGTWNKPAGCPANALVTVKVYGGGGGGGSGVAGAVSGAGGGGCTIFQCKAGDLASSVAITIGAGGAIGAAGGTSSFGATIIAGGGGPGVAISSNSNRSAGGGGGGGSMRAGAVGTTDSDAVSFATSSFGGAGGDNTAGNGGAASTTTGNVGNAGGGGAGYYGGGGGGGSADGNTSDDGGDGGEAVYGGGGGAGRFATSGGTSRNGGNGGAPGAAGSIPGGGGGSNAVGARGEIRVYVNG